MKIPPKQRVDQARDLISQFWATPISMMPEEKRKELRKLFAVLTDDVAELADLVFESLVPYAALTEAELREKLTPVYADYILKARKALCGSIDYPFPGMLSWVIRRGDQVLETHLETEMDREKVLERKNLAYPGAVVIEFQWHGNYKEGKPAFERPRLVE